MNEERAERSLRQWFTSAPTIAEPPSLHEFLAAVPARYPSPAGAHDGTERPRLLSPVARRRDLAIVLVAAAAALALGAGLIAGLGPWRPVRPSPSLPVQATAPTSPGPIIPTAAGPYHWTLVSSSGELATYAVGSVIRRTDGSLIAIGVGQEARILTSTDGRAWTVEPADPGLLQARANYFSSVSGIVEGSTGFVAVGATVFADASKGDARAWTSSDGIRWQAAPSSAGMVDASMESVTAGPNGFVAVGSDGYPGGNTQLPGARGAAVWVSSNGTDWTRVPNQKSFEGGVMFGVRRTSSGYVAWGEIHDAFGSSPPLPPIWTSSDGLHWDRVTGIADAGGLGNPIRSIVAVGDRLIAVGYQQPPVNSNGTDTPAAWWSAGGGRSWMAATTPDGSGASSPSGGMSDVSVSGSDLLAVGLLDAPPGQVGFSPPIVWRSTDQGTSWTALPNDPSFAGAIMERVIGIDGRFVAFGSSVVDPNALSNPNLIWLAEPTPTAAPSPSAAASNADVAAALQTAKKFEAARASGDWPTAWALLSAYSKGLIGTESAFQGEESAYNAAGGSTYRIDPPTQNPDLLSATYLGDVYTDVAANADISRAWIVVVQHPNFPAASAATTTLVVASIGNSWAVWIGH